jgi:hypothetical protein
MQYFTVSAVQCRVLLSEPVVSSYTVQLLQQTLIDTVFEVAAAAFSSLLQPSKPAFSTVSFHKQSVPL